MRVLIYVSVAAVALIAGALIAQYVQPPQPTATTAATSSVLDHSLLDLAGSRRPLREWQGRVLFINFWATWCAPCREEIPHIQKARERYKNRNFEVIGIAIDERKPVVEYRDEFEIEYPLLLAVEDPIALLNAFGNEQGALPHSVVLGSTGNVLATHTGPLLPDQLTALIEAHL